ncbi:MAG: UDP-3-O-(3-hydroxymyristoyl)glucosamine N-acyltransferase [Bacteroidota bacterium]
MKAQDIARMLDAELVGDGNLEVSKVAKIEGAQEGELTFLANQKYMKFLETTGASVILVSKTFDVKSVHRTRPLTYVRVADPYLGFLRVLKALNPPVETLPSGIHPTAVIAKSASIGDSPSIGAHVVIGERCRIGANTRIHHGTVIADDVHIGENCLLYANVTVHERCTVDNRVIIHSGTVIGSDGFGFAPRGDGTYEKIPQIGTVVIEDDVEIGANCSIDRASLGETLIKRGVKLDNLIQVAHNVSIGEHTVIAAQTGISGSTRIGDNCMIAGQVGFVGHIEVADGVTVGAQSGVSRSLQTPGGAYFGYPAKEHRRALRLEAALRQLPDVIEALRALERRILEVERDLKEAKPEVHSR